MNLTTAKGESRFHRIADFIIESIINDSFVND